MQDDVLNGYEKAEHYSSFVNLEEDLEADIRVFTVYGDSTDSMDEEFQMIQYRFNRDVTRGLISSAKNLMSLQITTSSP